MSTDFVSRAGLKLEHAMAEFRIDAAHRTCADLGCNAGGFTDCLLRRGAARVYAVDTGYGMLEYKLRKDPRVVTMERTNAMHVTLPEPVSLIVIDIAWTRQQKILPSARRLLPPPGTPGTGAMGTGGGGGDVVTLIKPHYEAAPHQLKAGILKEEELPSVLDRVKADIAACGFTLLALTTSPIKGAKGNTELLAHLQPRH